MSKPVNIYIQSKDLLDLIEFYDLKLKAIRQRKKDLERDESEIRATIMQLRAKQNAESSDIGSLIKYSIKPNMNEYSKRWIWAKKVDFAIREAGKPLTTNEIVDTLMIYEPSFEDDKRRAIASVSSITSVHSGSIEDKEKRFIRIDDETGRSKFFVRDEEDIFNEEGLLEDEKSEPKKDLPDITSTQNYIEDLPF